MNLLFWALTIAMAGKVMLGIGILISYTELAIEKRIDYKVIKSFRIERVLTLAGIAMIIFGYFLEIYFYDFLSLLTCQWGECAASAATAAAAIGL